MRVYDFDPNSFRVGVRGAFYIYINRIDIDKYLWHDGTVHTSCYEDNYEDCFNRGYWHKRDEAEKFLGSWKMNHRKQKIEHQLEQALKDEKSIQKNVESLKKQLKGYNKLRFGDVLRSNFGSSPGVIRLVDMEGNILYPEGIIACQKEKVDIAIIRGDYTFLYNVFDKE